MAQSSIDPTQKSAVQEVQPSITQPIKVEVVNSGTDWVAGVTIPLAILIATLFWDWRRSQAEASRSEKDSEEQQKRDDRRRADDLERQDRQEALTALHAVSEHVQVMYYLCQQRDVMQQRAERWSEHRAASGSEFPPTRPTPYDQIETLNRERVTLSVTINIDRMRLAGAFGDEIAQPLVGALAKFTAAVDGEGTASVQAHLHEVNKLIAELGRPLMKRPSSR